jgi:hypothetical protein
MENTMIAGVTYTYNVNEMNEKISETIDFIKNWADENNYRIIGNIENYKNLPVINLSKSKMKQIQKYCFWISQKPSLKKINSFFSLLSKTYGVERVQVKVSAKEEAIQNARKQWLKARNESDKLLKAYKEEKGNFYKNKV